MKNKLHQLMQYLTAEQKNKELIEIEYNDELKRFIGSEPIIIHSDTVSKGLYIPSFGELVSSEDKFDVVRINRQGNLVIKPKKIQEYLDSDKRPEIN